ncbi:hypothetical protein [Streptomyces mirabilis]|uniref:hypothetical protein n=1 Tax=Streptomyces mirabilis TaxID=68239 RepID=UPI003697A9FD
MRKKMLGALAPVVLAAGAVIPLSATPAAADPPCAEDVYPKQTGEFTFQVTVTLNRCDRPTRALIKCAVPFGGGISKGNTVTTGTSETLCSRNTLPGDTGWEVYYSGAWHARWM